MESSTTPTPAQRFYAASDSRNRQFSDPGQGRNSSDVAALLSQPSHRYHCVLEYLRATPDQAVVELGFGNDQIAVALARWCRTYRIVDVVDRRRESTSTGNIAFTNADLNLDFPFADRTFDCTVAMMVIEHLFDPFHSFSEVARITRPGGKVFVNLPNIASIRCRLQLLLGLMPVTSSRDWFDKHDWDGNHLHNFTFAETLRIARKFGLALDRIHAIGRAAWFKQLRPSLLCHEISFAFSRL
jgi:SAM-dependent methyltransferase